jgi:hypothetical protein
MDERLAQRALEDDDFAWAKPFLDEAEADIAQGNVMPIEEHRVRNASRLAAHTPRTLRQPPSQP